MPRTVKRVEMTTVPSSQTKLLTAEQVMELLSVSRTGLHYLMRLHGLPYIKLGESRGAALRFNEQSVAQWLARNERQEVSC